MNQETYRNELIARITDFISDREINSGMVASSYADLIIRYVFAKPEEVLATLDRVIEQKNNNFESIKKYGKKYLSLPIPESGLEIRCYFQERFPSLKFRVRGEKNSFLGLKKERNGPNIVLSASFDDKRQEKGFSDYETNNEIYTFNPNGTLLKKHQSRVTPPVQGGQKVDITKIETESPEDARQLELLNLIYFCMSKNQTKLTANLSIESLDVLFSDFFKQAKEMFSFDDELDLYELLRAVSQLIYFKEELGPASIKIQESGEDFNTFKTNGGRKTTLFQSSGEKGTEPIEIQGKGKEDNFYDTFICNEMGEPRVRYMFMQTPKGFSVYKNYLGETENTTQKSVTIGLCKNQLRIANTSNSPRFVPAAVEIRFNENGSVEYEYQKIEAYGSSGFEKVDAETLYKIISAGNSEPPTKI